MSTFIDESGNTGAFRLGGSRYFMAAVWVSTIEEAESFRIKIGELRRQLGLPESFEFKFAKTSHKSAWREAFFATALSEDFRFVFSSIDKDHDRWVDADRKELIWACTTDLAVAMRPIYHRAEAGRLTPLKEPIFVSRSRFSSMTTRMPTIFLRSRINFGV